MDEKIQQTMQKHIHKIEGFENTHLVGWEPGHVRLELDVPDTMQNRYGIIHGGALFTLCDMASGMTVTSVGRTSVTLEGGIHYIKAVKNGRITIESRSVHKGRSTMINRVDVCGEGDVLLATATMTMFITGEI